MEAYVYSSAEGGRDDRSERHLGNVAGFVRLHESVCTIESELRKRSFAKPTR